MDYKKIQPGKKYKGILAKPINMRAPPIGTLLSPLTEEEKEEKRAAIIAECLEQEFERYAALFDEFGIKRGDWPNLALALARTHVPGFRIEIKNSGATSGRPKFWNPIRLWKLWRAVEEYKRTHPAISVSKACDEVGKQKEWRGSRWVRPSRLRERYYEAKESPLVKLEINVGNAFGQDEAREMFNPLADELNPDSVK